MSDLVGDEKTIGSAEVGHLAIQVGEEKTIAQVVLRGVATVTITILSTPEADIYIDGSLIVKPTG